MYCSTQYRFPIPQVASSVKHATSISLTTDSATLPTGESFIAVTGHWIDRLPSDTSGKCNWKLLSAVLAVSVDNGNRLYHSGDCAQEWYNSQLLQ